MTSPLTRRDAVVDTLHGVDVPDPYRWLEEGDDPEVQHWIAEQNRLTRTALDALPAREIWHERLVAYMGLPVVQGVEVRGDRLIMLEREAGEQQARLVARPLADPASMVTVLAEPAAGTADAAVAVDWFFASADGELVAFGVSEGGSEDAVLRVARSADGTWLDDEISNCRAASVAWEPDGTGFYYTRYPEGDEYNRTVHHHTLGDHPGDDPVVWAEHPTPQTWPNVSVSPEGRWVLVEAMVGWSRTDQHLFDRMTGTWRAIIAGVDAVTDFVFADEHHLVGMTTLDAPRGRIVRVALDRAIDPSAWVTLVPERDVVIGAPAALADGFVVTTSRAGVDAVERWSADGSLCDPIEGIDMSAVAQLATDRTAGVALAVVSGFDAPTAVWRLDHHHVARRLHPVITGATPDLAVSQVEYPSLDGEQIGMFLIHRSDVVPDADTPTILNGYGGFAITETPVWSAMIAAWCAAGGLYAIAGLRGGFEHGEDWHQAGRRANKQNVFDDFHSAADWLVDTGRTSRDRLAIAGGSNGGLLVGAALTQRPDLCSAVWCAVPLLDMIRFPLFRIARLWTDEYGDPDVAEEFEWLHAFSPYHHVHAGAAYPAVLLTTAEGDTRVDPLHARKMAAMLQHAAPDLHVRPVLLHQEGRAGHGVGKPVGKRAAEQADVLAFLSSQLGFDPDRGVVNGARLAGVLVGGTSEAWVAAGFAVDAEGRIPFVNGALEFTGSGSGLLGFAVDGVDELPDDIEGIVVQLGASVSAVDHPNGAFELDHVVIVTGSLERTSDAVADALGLERRRIRETPEVRQGFHRFADRGCIIEIVERPGLERVGLWGLVVNVFDLDAVSDAHGPDVIGPPKPAVQPGRRIATFRSSAGLGVPVASMSPDV